MAIKKLKVKTFKWQGYVLIAILVLSFFLNFWMLYKEGYSNEYYAAAVKSMLTNAKAFFYGSFDSGLYVTVDKPPLGLWIEALSASVFGVNSFGLIFPSAFAGSMSVLLVYSMVKKYWAETAGIISAAIMATTPILVALSRTNNLDIILLFFILCGAAFVLEAANKQSLGYYILAMVFLGLGFNVKMLQAFLVLPAFVLIYFFGKGKFSKKLLHTFFSVCTLAVVSLSWALYVDSVPESQRPYIGSSGDNSVMNLIVGYNGLSRLTGQQGSKTALNLAYPDAQGFLRDNREGRTDTAYPFEKGTPQAEQEGEILIEPVMPNDNSGNISQSGLNISTTAAPQIDSSNVLSTAVTKQDGSSSSSGILPDDAAPDFNATLAPQMDGLSSSGGTNKAYDADSIINNLGKLIGTANMGGPGGDSESGTKGILRLYSSELSGLISWFLLPALAMLIFAAFCCGYWFKKRKTLMLSYENRQKLNSIIFFSVWLLPMAVFFSIGGFIHRYYVVMLCPAIAALTAIAAKIAWESKYRKWLVPASVLLTLLVQCIIVMRTSWALIMLPMIITAAAGIVIFFIKKEITQKIAAALMLLSLFIAPLAWAITPVIYNNNSTIPNAGPALADSSRGSGSFNMINSQKSDSNSMLDEFLLKNYNGQRWAIAVSSANDAAPIILETGLPVMAIGGFSGSDSIMTLDKLKEYVANGELRYYYASSQRGWQSSEITAWVEQNGTKIELSSGAVIYDLSGMAD